MDDSPTIHPTDGHHLHRPTAETSVMGSLRLLSINHRSSPLEVLERMALSPQRVVQLYDDFHATRLQPVVVSTCNRTEIYWSSPGQESDAVVRAKWLAAGEGHAARPDHFVALRGRAAAAHLFRVAAGLESMAVGESEILAQLRSALELADERYTPRRFVSVLFRAALRFGGKARQETGIGRGAMSVASASVTLLARAYPDLPHRTVLVVGAGATGCKTARHLIAKRVGRLVFLNRTRTRGEQAATELGCESAPLEDLPEWMARADALVAAVQAPSAIVTARMLQSASPARGNKARILVDLSLPRAIEPACALLPGVEHYDLSGLKQIVAFNRAQREHEIPRVEFLLNQELEEFEAQVHESLVRPVLAELRTLAESIRRSEIERACNGKTLDAEVLDQVTRRIVNRFLHGPSIALRRSDPALDHLHAHCLRLMFGLRQSMPQDTPPETSGAHGVSE